MSAQLRTGTALALCAAAAITAGACERNSPAAESQTMTVEPRMEPATAKGCLRAGMAENTFVLTTPGMQPGQEAEARP